MGKQSTAIASWPLWLIPLVYMSFGIAAGVVFPRLEYAYFPAFGDVVSVGSAQAYLSAISSGTITMTALVFSVMSLVMQLTSSAYSKRLAMLFAGHPLGLHALGVFSATFMYSLGVLQFVDRDHGGKVPWLSTIFATVLLVASMLLLALLVRRLAILRITYILQVIGDKGRVIVAAAFPPLDEHAADDIAPLRKAFDALRAQASRQRLIYGGVPLAIAEFRIDELARLAETRAVR